MKSLQNFIFEKILINKNSQFVTHETYKNFLKELHVFSDIDLSEVFKRIGQWQTNEKHDTKDLICVVSSIYKNRISFWEEYCDSYDYVEKYSTTEYMIYKYNAGEILISEDYIEICFGTGRNDKVFITTDEYVNICKEK